MQWIREKISRLSSITEIYLSLIIVVAVLLASYELLKFLVKMATSTVSPSSFQEFLGFAMALIIAVEFVKMLAKHTLGSTIEVLVFALARKLIIGENSRLFDLLLGVAAIAVLFAIRKFLYIPGTKGNQEEIVSDPETPGNSPIQI